MINEKALSIFGLKTGKDLDYNILNDNFKLKLAGCSQSSDVCWPSKEKKLKKMDSPKSVKIYKNTEQDLIENEKIETELIDSRAKINIIDLIKDLNRNSGSKNIEISLKNENEIQSYFTFEIIKASNSGKVYFFFFIQDQSKTEELKNLQSLNQFNDQLYSLSHEIRTSINGALPNLELIKNHIEDERVLKFLDIPIGSLKLLQNYLDNLFGFNLLQKDQFFMNKREFNLNDLITEIWRIVNPMIEMRNLNFILEVANSEKIRLITDYMKLKQVLLNLIINAIQFTYSGDIILKINRIGEKSFKFLIQDTGIGMNKLELANIKKKMKEPDADPFSSADNGMGLLISEKLSVLLGSEHGIEIESEINEGSQFFFVITSDDKYFYTFDEKISQKNATSFSDISKMRSKLNCSYKTGTNSSLIEEKRQLNRMEQQLKKSTSGLEDVEPTFSKSMKLTSYSSKNFMEEKFRLKYNFEPLVKLLDNLIDPKPKKINPQLSSDPYIKKIALDSFNHSSFVSNTRRNTENEILKTPTEVSSHFKNFSKKIESNLFKTSSLTVNGQVIKRIICECEDILYIDDNIFNLLSGELVLKSFDLKCCKVLNGFEAIKELKKKDCRNSNCKRFRLILMDFKMPIMDGFETTKKIMDLMQNKIITEIPIIGCTAFASKDEILRSYEVGIKDVILKPININLMKNILNDWLI